VVVAEGFLGRWSQRKKAVREGKALDEAPELPDAKPLSALVPSPVASAETPQAVPAPPVPAAPTPTLEDVQRLTPQSDFAPFVARDLAPEIRNAAMKKLFADPHYNVMDRLDIYIDDYSKPDPLPQSLLRQMASAKFLKLFEEEEDPDIPPAESMAESAQAPQTGAFPLTENLPQEPSQDHDHTDLRLQPNHAAGRPEPGRGTE
jgi:hypothetical protein